MNKIINFLAGGFLLSPQLSQADDVAPAQAEDVQQQLDDLQTDYYRYHGRILMLIS